MTADRGKEVSRRDFVRMGLIIGALGGLGASTRRAFSQDIDPTPAPTTPESFRNWRK